MEVVVHVLVVEVDAHGSYRNLTKPKAPVVEVVELGASKLFGVVLHIP